MTRIVYEEEQPFATFIYFLTAGILLASTIGAFLATLYDAKAPRTLPWILLVVYAVAFAVIMNLLFLRVRVTTDLLLLQLGYLIPLGWKKIPVREIQNARVVTYRPILDAGGWGIRFGRFEGASCSFWNARGNRGVYLEAGKRRYIIGSQQPEALLAALQEVCQKT